MYPGGWWASDRPRAVDIILGACMLIRRDVIEQVGSLDERFFIYTEEVDLCRRILEAGWEIYWLPAAEIVHYGGASTSQVSSRMFLELYRSKVQYFRKHFGVWGALAYKGVLLAGALPRLVLMPAVAALVPSRRRRSLGVLRNYSSLLVQLPAL
jgi:GT2 family glycosyltransferase